MSRKVESGEGAVGDLHGLIREEARELEIRHSVDCGVEFLERAAARNLVIGEAARAELHRTTEDRSGVIGDHPPRITGDPELDDTVLETAVNGAHEDHPVDP